MISIADNFNLTGSTKPLDSRDEFNTLADMKACTVCNELHICYNKETQKQYQYSSSNTDDTTTGKWREYTPGGGGGEGTITGATIGGNPVTESGGVLQLPAYPTVPITGIKDSNGNNLTPVDGKVTLPAPPSVPIIKIKVDGASDDLPINDGRVVIPSTPVKGIKTNSGTDLTPDLNGKVTLPPIPVDQSTRIKNIEESIAQMGNNQPIVIPSSAVELPVSTSDPDYIDYDSDTTYVMNIDGTQVATIHYPYIDNSNNYIAFKAIDRDLYYVYSVSVVNDAERYTYSNQYTWSTLPADAKSKFESGIYAIKQLINDDGTLPEKKWYKNIPSVFVDKNNLPLRSRRIVETVSSSVIDVVLVKNDRLNKIYRYAFNGISNAWVLINGGCYTKDDSTTGADYNKYDKFFDRLDAFNVDYDNTSSGLSATNAKAAIDETFITLKHTPGSATVSSASFTLPSTVTGNTYYDITSTPITSLTIPTIDSPYEIVIKFTTDSTDLCTIAIPNNQKYIGDLNVDKGVTCMMSIFNGIIVIAETETNS